MNSQFHIIDKSTWERSVYFDYYYNQIKCKYNLNANLDITRLTAAQKAKGLHFFPVMLYVIMKAVNRDKEFRMSFDEDGRIQIPVSVFVSHAVADGYHTCKLINDMQEIEEACLG